MISIDLQASEVEARLAGLALSLPRHAAAALHQEAEAVMTRAKEQYVPVDTGVLRASGYVAAPDIAGQEVTVALGFGGPAAPYALSVHENPRAGKTGGITPSGHQRQTWAQVGQWKYLETPVLEAQAGFLDRLAGRIRLLAGLSG